MAKTKNPQTIDEALDRIDVIEVDDDFDDDGGLKAIIGWYAVVDDDGVNAYFSTEKEALRHRLDLVNRRLNG